MGGFRYKAMEEKSILLSGVAHMHALNHISRARTQNGKTMEQIGLSHGEIGNLRKQEILRLTATAKEKTPPLRKHLPGNGRIYVLTEKAKLALKEMAVS